MGQGAILVIYLALVVFFIVSSWKMFSKAGQPGWAAVVPIYNIYVLLKIVGRPAWWLLLWFIPLVNIVTSIIVCLELARSFGRGTGFGIGLCLLPFIFQPILGFGAAQYEGPAAKHSAQLAPAG